jgi:hypothetical protein
MNHPPELCHLVDLRRLREREAAVAKLACILQNADEANRAIELAERVGLEEWRASTAPTSAVVKRHIDVMLAIAARGEPLPADTNTMRVAARDAAAREMSALLGDAFPCAR